MVWQWEGLSEMERVLEGSGGGVLQYTAWNEDLHEAMEWVEETHASVEARKGQ